MAAMYNPAAREDPMTTGATRPATEDAIQATLRMAIGLARYAPSLHNSQPWVWRVTGETAELSTDPRRSVPAADPSGRDTVLGCGAALHHARTGLAAAGWRTHTALLPDPNRPNLLARIELAGRQSPHQTAIAMAGAISRRRVEGRPVHAGTLPVHTVAALRSAVRQEGCRLVVTAGQVAPGRAGVPAGADERPAWAMLYADGDSRADELRAGQAMSALMLTATHLGVALSVQSQPLEVAALRAHVHDRPLDNLGYQQFVVRLGRRPELPAGQPPAARTAASETHQAETAGVRGLS